MRALLVSVFLLAVAAVAIYAQSPMRAGQWETTMSMQMAGMTMPDMKSSRCVTPEELEKDPSSGLPSGARTGNNDACKVSDYKVAGSKVTWKMTCTGAQPMTGEGDLTFAGDAYKGTIKMTMAQGAMSMNMSGTRTGDCTK